MANLCSQNMKTIAIRKTNKRKRLFKDDSNNENILTFSFIRKK